MTARLGLALSPSNSVTEPHDLFLDATGNLAMVTDAEAVGQHARQRLMAFSGEWFLDTTAGVSWLTDLLGKRENLPLAEAIVKSEILDTDGVTGISEFSVRFIRALRKLDYTRIVVATEYDEETRL